MSLKNECIDMIRLIADSMGTDYEYDLEIDSYRDICELKSEDVTYSGCIYCENEGDCKYLKHIKVDVSFWDYADFQKNYIFSCKDEQPACVTHIRNRKHLLQEMKEMKKELELYKDYCADFGNKYDELMEYAKEFAEQLKNDYVFFSLIDSNVLPIILHKDNEKDEHGSINMEVGGNVKVNGLQAVINVYCVMDDIEQTKQNLRHELIHYCLYMIGMKYRDTDAIFHYLCDQYDAYAYKPMSEYEQQLYDKLVIAVENMEKFNVSVSNEQDERNNLRVAMIMAVGNERENASYAKTIERVHDLLKMLGSSGDNLLSTYSNIDTDKPIAEEIQRNLAV